MADLIKIRRDTKAHWDAVSGSVILQEGEIGIITDATPKQCKIGNGYDVWGALPYQSWVNPDKLEDYDRKDLGYVVCSTGGGQDAKVVNDPTILVNYELGENVRLLVKMNQANTASGSITLAVNGTDAKPLQYNGAAASNTNTWANNEVLDVYYDGTSYIANTHGGAQFATGQKVSDVSIESSPVSGSANLVTSGGIFGAITNLSSSLNEQIDNVSSSLSGSIDNVSFSTGEKVNQVGIDNEPVSGSTNLVKSGGVQNELALGAVYDVSAKNPTGGPNNNGKWASLSALLSDANLNTLIPTSVRKGGMSIKFVQTSDNKYVQCRLLTQTFSTNESNWAVCDEGVYIENPEYLYIKTDNSEHIIIAVKKNGDLYFGAGVPQQIKEYIQDKILELHLDKVDDIITFLGTLLTGDKTLQQLFNEKVDKETGKSLINADFATGVSYNENPEWLNVETDVNGNIVEGVKKNGEKYFAGGIPIQSKEYIDNKVDTSLKTITKPTYSFLGTSLSGIGAGASYSINKSLAKGTKIKVEYLCYSSNGKYTLSCVHGALRTLIASNVTTNVKDYILPYDADGLYIVNNHATAKAYIRVWAEAIQDINYISNLNTPVMPFKKSCANMIATDITPNDVFSQEIEGQPISRIPEVIVANDGSVLVKGEIRELSSELGKFDLWIKRYVNGVLTNTIPIYTSNETYGACACGHAFVIDRIGVHGTAGKIWLFYGTKKNMYEYPQHQTLPDDCQMWYVTSVDNGITWSEPVNVSNLKTANAFIINPSDGIQASDGTLYIDLYSFPIPSDTNRSHYFDVLALKPNSSDWEVISFKRDGIGGNEAAVYEDEKGDIVFNTRTDNSNYYRLYFRYNKYTNEVSLDKELQNTFMPFVRCQGDIIKIDRTIQDSTGRSLSYYYLMSFPDPSKLNNRSPLVLWASLDAIHWMRVYYIYDNASEGYTGLGYYDNHLYCAYEVSSPHPTKIYMKDLTAILPFIEKRLTIDWYMTSDDLLEQHGRQDVNSDDEHV